MRELYRLSAHELGSVLKEETRLLAEEKFTDDFAEVVEKGMHHRNAARSAYLQHLVEHGCLETQAARVCSD